MALRKGFIYIITDREHRWARIGMSRNPERKLKTLQDNFPFELELRAWAFVKDARECEKKMHSHLADLHMRGEWFKYDELRLKELVPLIKEHSYDS